MKSNILVTLTVLSICFVIYGFYWIGKHGSYVLFYEGMVQETVKEMVKSEYLRK